MADYSLDCCKDVGGESLQFDVPPYLLVQEHADEELKKTVCARAVNDILYSNVYLNCKKINIFEYEN